MARLRHHYQEFVQRETEVVVVAPEPAARVRHYWEQHALPFVGLADPDHEVARLYGQQVRLVTFGRLPALFVVDKQGEVRFQRFGTSMRDIVPIATVLDVLDQLNAPFGSAGIFTGPRHG
jgi:peroxiredoxin Q/BCP